MKTKPVLSVTDRDVLIALKGWSTLDSNSRVTTDEVAWIALRYSCSRAKAKKMIDAARAAIAKATKDDGATTTIS